MIYLFLAFLCSCLWVDSSQPCQQDVSECFTTSSKDRPFSGAVICDDNSFKLQTHTRSCVTSSQFGNGTVAGSCFQAYTNVSNLPTFFNQPIPISNTTELDEWMCGPSNRAGTLCGMCNNKSVIDLNSLLFECVQNSECTKLPWVQSYVLFQYLPLTFFFLVLVLLQPKLLSPSTSIYIHLSQMLSLPIIIYNVKYCLAMSLNYNQKLVGDLTNIIQLLYGIWNLALPDFMKLPSCLPSHTSVLEAIVLQYVVALYCLLLVVLLYVGIELYAHNFRPLVLAWIPFKKCFAHFHNILNPRASVIDVFATFFLLSYTKIVSTSVYLLLPVPLHNCSGHIVHYVLFIDGSTGYMSQLHLPYVLLATLMLLVFGVLPIILLVSFQFKSFQRCLTMLDLRKPGLIAFVDVFHGHYKDGTNGDTDYRFFAGIRFITWLVAVILATMSAPYKSFKLFALLWFLSIAIFVLVLCPYKQKVHNFTEGLVLLYLLIQLQIYLLLDATHFSVSITAIIFLSYCLLLLPAFCFMATLLHSTLQTLKRQCERQPYKDIDSDPVNEQEPLFNSV